MLLFPCEWDDFRIGLVRDDVLTKAGLGGECVLSSIRDVP
jgi:hypothetical protein